MGEGGMGVEGDFEMTMMMGRRADLWEGGVVLREADDDQSGMGGRPGEIDGIGAPIMRRSRFREQDKRVPGPWTMAPREIEWVGIDPLPTDRPSRPSAGDWQILCLGEVPSRPGTRNVATGPIGGAPSG
jgi:hypothetical protein